MTNEHQIFIDEGSRSNFDQKQGENQQSDSGSGSGSGYQGFASMEPDRQREIAFKGGRASYSKTQQQAEIEFDKGKQADDDVDESTPGTQGITLEQHAESWRQSQ